jgi:hypothetical protein
MTSLGMIVTVARRLETLRGEVAFVGGATTSLLITDPALDGMALHSSMNITSVPTPSEQHWQGR